MGACACPKEQMPSCPEENTVGRPHSRGRRELQGGMALNGALEDTWN